MRAAEATEVLQLVEALMPEKVLDGMENRARVRFHGDPVLRSQDAKIKGRHQRDQRGRRGLMPTDLEAVAAIHLMVGVMDHKT